MAQIDLGEGAFSHMRVTTRNLSNNKKFPIWASIPRCTYEDCPVFDECGPNVKDRTRLVRCKVQRSYLKEVERVILDSFADKLDQEDLMRFGLQLMPLYGMLCKLKIVELGITSPTTTTERYTTVHPVFKEIRATIKALSDLWNSLLKDKKLNKPSIPGDGTASFDNYYENLEKAAAKEEEEMGLVPRNVEGDLEVDKN